MDVAFSRFRIFKDIIVFIKESYWQNVNDDHIITSFNLRKKQNKCLYNTLCIVIIYNNTDFDNISIK